ncbi:MAG: hypothetical protein N2438_01525 [Limisphaera sp.]|nr:hypothetical protein [Limisphaera sp.]
MRGPHGVPTGSPRPLPQPLCNRAMKLMGIGDEAGVRIESQIAALRLSLIHI